VLIGFRIRIQDHFSISVNLDVDHGERAGLCPPSDTVVYILLCIVYSVHLVNVEQRQAAANPQTKPLDLDCESACFRQLSSTTTIAIYYYSARKLIFVNRPIGRRLS